MLIRFTEFLKHDNQEINMYVVQETEESANLSFRVYIKEDDYKGTLKLLKTSTDEWIINAEDDLTWINEIKPLIVSLIDKRICENDYALSGGLK